MFALKSALFGFFGWLMLLGSADLTTVSTASYLPVDNIIATDAHDPITLFFDAVLDVNHSFTYETPAVKIFPESHKIAQSLVATSHYQLTYYTIGQQIMINLSTKTIIFPFHCFT